MRRGRRHGSTCSLAVLGALLLTVWGTAAQAAPIAACTARDITDNEPGCPSGSGPCTITKDYAVGDGCTLDFGTRAVTLSSTATLSIGYGTVTLDAGSLTIAAGGFIYGNSTPPGDMGGSLIIITTGEVNIQKAGTTYGKINVSADPQAGSVQITAGGSVNISGRIYADQLTSEGDGGTIKINAGGDIVSYTGSIISATGGTDGESGGEIDLTAHGKIDLSSTPTVSGSDGGDMDFEADGGIYLRGGAEAVGDGDAGSGGWLIVIAGTGRGADTAVVIRPVNSQDFFDMKVREILCKPRL
jgi:hypothetical protein